MVNKIIVALTGLFLMASMVMAQEEFKPSFDNKGSRIAVGFFDSGTNGSYPKNSVQEPDCKLRFNWNMAPNITVVTRLSMSNAGAPAPDYFYMDQKNLLAEIAPSLKDSAFNPLFRIGRLKIDFGEETFADNPVEAATVNNSAPIPSGYDEGWQLSQSLHKDVVGVPLKWSLGMTSGNTGTGVDNKTVKAMCAKVGVVPIPELYISVSNYNSGNLGNQAAEFSYAKLTALPGTATEWKRTMSELDVRYDIQPGNENRLNPGAPAWTDSKAYVRVAFGSFNDTGKDKVAPIVTVKDRKGSYYFVEGLYNATDKIYLGLRLSSVQFSDSKMYDSLNSVANCNKYGRTSFGVGYRLAGNSHVKIENTSNTYTLKTGTTKPEANQTSLVFTSKF